MPVVPWVRPSQGSVQAPAKGMALKDLRVMAASATSAPSFPVAGVEAEGDGGAVGGAQASVGAEDEDFRADEFLRFPSHACVLAQAEEIA